MWCVGITVLKGWFSVGAWTGTLKNPTKCLWRWEPERRSNFFGPPAHLWAVTYMTEISLIVTLNSQLTSLLLGIIADESDDIHVETTAVEKYRKCRIFRSGNDRLGQGVRDSAAVCRPRGQCIQYVTHQNSVVEWLGVTLSRF